MSTPRTVGERLGKYVGESGSRNTMSIRAFSTRMMRHIPKPNGSTRAMIHRYLKGTQPPLDFIKAAASILEINVEWLAFGKGSPNAAAATTEGINAIAQPRGSFFQDVARRIKRAVIGSDTTGLVPHWVTPLGLLLVTRDLLDYNGESEAARFGTIGRILRGPLKAVGLDPRTMSEAALSEYVMGMTPVLYGLANYREQTARTEAAKRTAEEQHRRVLDLTTRTITAAEPAQTIRRPKEKVRSRRRRRGA